MTGECHPLPYLRHLPQMRSPLPDPDVGRGTGQQRQQNLSVARKEGRYHLWTYGSVGSQFTVQLLLQPANRQPR